MNIRKLMNVKTVYNVYMYIRIYLSSDKLIPITHRTSKLTNYTAVLKGLDPYLKPFTYSANYTNIFV